MSNFLYFIKIHKMKNLKNFIITMNILTKVTLSEIIKCIRRNIIKKKVKMVKIKNLLLPYYIYCI